LKEKNKYKSGTPLSSLARIVSQPWTCNLKFIVEEISNVVQTKLEKQPSQLQGLVTW